MRENNMTCPQSALEQMSTRQLDMLLQAELQKEIPDEEVVLPILEVLRGREKGSPAEISENAQKAWETYKARAAVSVLARSARKRNWIRIVAATAAVAAVLIMAIPNTVGAESIFDILFRWTESIFEFLKPGENSELPVEYAFQTDNPGLQRLYNEVAAMGITTPIVPAWLPEGYELTELKIKEMEQGTDIFAVFENGNNEVLFTYWIPPRGFSLEYEKDDNQVKVVEKAGVQHFVITNEDQNSMMWINDNVECHINAGLTENELYQLLDSIYLSAS